ncbi:MAG: 30S ribosomal protein S2, partial [Rickettsiales bacterium]
MMALPAFSMRDLIDAGVHFGHKTKRWNPRMAPYIYGTRNDVHIIDLQQTVPLLHRALGVVRSTVLKNGRILFVGTKRQASDSIVEAAQRCGQYYVNNRWLGGMLTNWQTIQGSIRQLRKYEELLAQENSGLTKKERLTMQRDRDKLERSLGGIRDMGGKPDLLVVIDTNREELAIKEAQKLGIPIVAIIDTNCTADGIDYPIPGNDDATRAIKLYCKLISDAALDGLQESLGGRTAPAKKQSSEMEEALNAEVPVEAKEEKPEAKPARGG